jgi:autotransporter-associated beta strand protein
LASNWAGGAIPDLSNVANVVIPTGTSVSYDSGVAGPVTSQVAANGGLSLANAGAAVSLGGISGSGSIALGTNNLSLTAATGGNFSGAISGAGGLTVAGGTQTLSGANTYTGNTAINSGASLIIAGAGQLGGGNYAGSITNNGSFVYASSATQTVSGVISGSGSLTQTAVPSGAPVGTLILAAANTYTGATTVNAGTLAITNAGALGSGSASTTVNTGGTLDLRNVTGVAEPITLAGGTLATSTGTSSVTAPISISGASTVDVDGTELTLSGVISGSGSLEKEGNGTLILTAANTYTGSTAVDAGTLAITNVDALGSAASGSGTTVNTGGTLDLRNVTGVVEPITLNGGTLATSTGSSSVTSPMTVTGASTIDVGGTQLTLEGPISGSGSLEKEGAGTLILTVDNTNYTGATTVDAGTLAITNAGALGSSAGGSGTTVNTGGTLDLRNVTGVAEPITLAGGTLAVSTGSSSVTSPMTITGASAIDVDGTQLTLTSAVSGSGSLDKTGTGTLLLAAANTYTGATRIDAGVLKLAANASISESDKVVVGANAIFDTRAITGNVFIESLAGSGSVLNGSVAPNSLVITDAKPGDVFSGVISGTGGLRITGGTQTLTGINTYSGPTVVSPGANLIAAIQSIPGDVVNNGSFGFSQSTAGTYSNNMSGTGTMVIGGTGTITLTGQNTQSGGTRIESGASVMIGSTNALSGNRLSSNNGSLGIASGVTLSSLDVTGTVILTTDIITTGAQSYENIKFATSSDRVSTLQTNNADITISGTIDGVQNKMQSSVINAGTGIVTLGDSIGSIARLNDFTVTGSRINILADILTGMTQTYNGSVYIGNGSYIGKPAKIGFLYERSYVRYFDNDANTTIVGSSIAKLNDNPIYVRTLISVDPSITFNGTVNDTVPNTHTLLLAAISDQSVPASAGFAAINNAASINFNGAVGSVAPLYSLNSQVRVNLIQSDGATSFIGQINVKDGVSTYSDQTYRANSMVAQASSRGGEVTFSIFDPQSSITFNLPRQTADNSGCSGASCGQLNLQNPGSLDLLRFNGDSNYLDNQNMSGAGRWGSSAIANNALGYVPPPVTEALRSNLETGSVLKQALQLMLASNESLANTGSRSRVDVSMTNDAISASSDRDRIGSGEFRMMASNQAIPAPERGFVNVIFRLDINGTSIQLVSSSPQKGFELKLPPMTLPKLDALLQQQRQDGDVKPVTLVATLANGRPLPSWLTFNPETQTFSASSIPEGTPDIQVKLQATQGGAEVDQVVFTIDTP